MIKAILFDFDGVLTTDKTGSQSILNALSVLTGIPVQTLKNAYYPFNKKLLYGEMSHSDMWGVFCEQIGASLDEKLLLEAFRRTPLDWEMLDILKSLKSKYKTGLITDNKSDRIDEIINYHHLSGLFDTVSVSARCRSGKDQRRIFDITLESLGILPHEAVFIDNSDKNLIVPREMGIKPILFDDESRDISRFLLELQRYI